LYFNPPPPPTLQETLQNPNPRREAHQIKKEMHQRSTVFISSRSPLSFKSITKAELRDIRMITRQQKKDSMNHFIGSMNIRYIDF
jgi:hypothetical protein